MTILVVEDNPLTRKLVRVTLEAEGYQVVEAPDGAAALASLDRAAPDLILQDLHLPDMDGFELVRRLRALPKARALPILAMSGMHTRLEEAQSAEVGFNSFLVKPVGPAHLVETVRLFLPRGSALDGARLGQGRRLLLVGDGSVEPTCAERFLSAQGFQVALAATAREALAAVRASPPELILTELLLPDLDGFGLCHAVRDLGLPVIILTPQAQEPQAAELARELGVNALVALRSGPEAIARAVHTALEQGPADAGELPLEAVRSRFLRSLTGQFKRLEAANASLVHQCAIQGSQMAVLGDLCQALAGPGDPEALLGPVLARCLDTAGVPKGALFLAGPGGELALSQAIGYLPEERPALAGFFGCAHLLAECLVRGSILSPTGQAGTHLSLAEGLSALLVPVVQGGQALGVLFLAVRGADLRGPDPLGFARALAAELAQALTLTAAFSRLALSEEHYRRIVESTTEGVWTIDPDRRTTFVNQRAADLLGYGVEEMAGRPIFDFSSEDQHALALELSGSALGGSSVARELPMRRRDGSERWVHLTASPLLDAAGRPVGAMALLEDRSEQRKLQEQLMVSDRMASVGTLAAGVAHEINNPLTAVLANLDLAQLDLDRLAGALGEAPLRPVAEKCRFAHEAAARVAQIVRDLKLFSRSGGDASQPVELQPVLESTLRMASNEIRHRARVVRDYQPVLRVLGNASRLGQVFLNLLVNAVQALPEGQAGQHEIRVATRPAPPGRVAVEISDTGSGMTPEVLRRLFTPFFTTKPAGVGTGLGLSICHRIITAMAGSIEVDSAPGQGTTFRILLPETREEPASATVPAPAPSPGRRASLLVVDDEPMVAAVLQGLLAPDYDVAVQARAQDALEQLRAGARFDLILCDLMMPGMTGMELHGAVLQLDPEQAGRMVFMSGGAFTPRARDFLAEGDKTCVDKPFDLPSLRSLIRSRTL